MVVAKVQQPHPSRKLRAIAAPEPADELFRAGGYVSIAAAHKAVGRDVLAQDGAEERVRLAVNPVTAEQLVAALATQGGLGVAPRGAGEELSARRRSRRLHRMQGRGHCVGELRRRHDELVVVASGSLGNSAGSAEVRQVGAVANGEGVELRGVGGQCRGEHRSGVDPSRQEDPHRVVGQ
jgi:hypothetical protein